MTIYRKACISRTGPNMFFLLRLTVELGGKTSPGLMQLNLFARQLRGIGPN
jgi:hypothetical protein